MNGNCAIQFIELQAAFMARPMNVLHIASFNGNIGDNANHMGFRPWFEKMSGTQVKWTSLEIREFYWKERLWDDDLADYINSFDRLVIGGGNYFELWVENSPTGTSIAIPSDVFQKIRIPVFFNALGVDPGQGVPEACRVRFTEFLETLLGSDQYLVSVRNDGALGNLKTHIGKQYADQTNLLPDHGFFVPCPAGEPENPDNRSRIIAINIASDMGEIRFKNFSNRLEFSNEMASLIGQLAHQNPEMEFHLVPHIFRDLEIISETLSCLDDRLRRTRVRVAAYGSGDIAARNSLAIYANAALVLGMRFHSNVCPMAMKRQVMGLNSYVQIEQLYEGLGQRERLLDITRPGFSEAGLQLASHLLLDPDQLVKGPAEAIEQVTCLRNEFEPRLKHWLAG